MHISEGVLNTQILVTTSLISASLLAYSVKKTKYEDISKTASLSAIFFLASFIHVPIGVTSVHLILSGLVGAFLGFNAILAIFIALFFQGLLFGYGGITTLGANTFIMGISALFGYFIFSLHVKEKFKSIQWFLVGFLPILMGAFLLSLILALNGEEFYAIAYLAFISNLPIMIIEGIITLFALKFIQKVAPKYLEKK